MSGTNIGSCVLTDPIGRGSFGTVFKGVHVTTGSEIAVKLESCPCIGSVENEAMCYQILAGGIGIPKLHDHGKHNDQHFIAIDLLGPSLTKVFRVVDFSIGTISIIAEKMVSCLEYVHSKGIIHQDVKPGNMLLGREPGVVCLADFGLAACWSQEDDPLEFEFMGSPTWASTRAHQGDVMLAPSDDLESLGYSLAHFVLGELPWRAQARMTVSEDDHSKLRRTKAMFIRKAHENLDLPKQLVEYIQYCRSRCYHPNYDYIRALWSLIGFEGEEFGWIFEWDKIDFDASSATSEQVTSGWHTDERGSADSYQYSLPLIAQD